MVGYKSLSRWLSSSTTTPSVREQDGHGCWVLLITDNDRKSRRSDKSKMYNLLEFEKHCKAQSHYTIRISPSLR
ncbi:uncharacterized protein PHALS_15066 [Plasmopara halstedii]|uniref:Uncharacterized protein n=1 Tax=Plasmopara halstedii TaxID=4781 RepID=A0A0P1A9C2_PLAHL|nr:uncharacterized protein PHALS_15066 [Plasmopara halstedii]CEG37361.1 hypothetical protein PHALS_15066 [Plasmopara halstedii]|eukprot:XP_024573730.1 hypothetical protein PHALS_15066 [Plasmopara halstedii]